ncbi:K00801 farnesyl-diphosphate farnesyltransferase [Cyberlindnera jadinii]|uniref:Squalene synthase n=1 Tax=Cyberlindnera jadinii (strain ATCC 18201 / CBS 1600 / BCRC 20928 / JCM 3617 / NBRC 0987 / NRRL Y-1542) TaxID=983966 RepID=A0A0H5C4F2_CYBJN|nr:K00801 farnesyl-diphosphate farnesyltransferase [Cyberlindnera jadinii]
MGKLLQLALHPDELASIVQFKLFRKNENARNPATESAELIRCYELLNLTSRSFAAVIEELHPELRNVIMVFYLVLRALDTVEDDMSIENSVKLPVLRQFHEKLDTKDWTFDGNSPNEKDRCVLVEFDRILGQYHELKPQYQKVIKEITEKMGNGMADYIENENFNSNGLLTIEDYDLYCYYVAGLVGDGLTQLIVLAKFGNSELSSNKQLFKSMGLFLQKTNIIRDYEEDQVDGRAFWPKEIWGKYANELSDFMKPENQSQGLWCISELVCNALDHVIDVLQYLALVEEQTSFNFCAIPQVMAIATLELVFQNPQVLTQHVKIRKGTTVSLILESRTLEGCARIFRRYLRKIHHKSHPSDPNYLRLGITIGKIEQFLDGMYPHYVPKGITPQTTSIRTQVVKRSQLDEPMKRDIDEEILKTRILLLSLGVAVFGVVYGVVRII